MTAILLRRPAGAARAILFSPRTETNRLATAKAASGCFASSWPPAMVRRWHADPFGFLRPWNEVPALMGSAPPATPPSTGTGVVTFLMGSLEAVGVTARVVTECVWVPRQVPKA